MSFLKTIEDPTFLRGCADVCSFIPAPVGPALAAGFRLAATFVEKQLSQEQIDAVVARYSAEAQSIADGWNG